MRKWAAVLAVAVGFAALAAPFAAIPLVRRLVESRAAALGFVVTVGEVRPVWGVARLRNVTVRPSQSRSVELALANVDVHPSLGARLFRIEVHGGKLTATGSLSEVRQALHGPGGGHSRGAEEGATRRSIPVRVDGIDAAWTGALGGSEVQRAWGLGLERHPDGSAVVSVDLARAEAGRQRVEVTFGRVDLAREAGTFAVLGASAERITTVLDLDAEQAQAPGPPSPPAASSSSGPAGAWRARIRDAAGLVTRMLAPGKAVALPPVLYLQVHHAGKTLDVGPATAFAERTSDTVRLGVTSRSAEHATPIQAELRFPATGGPIEAAFSGGPVSLSVLGIREGDMGLLGVDRAELEVMLRARLAEDLGRVTVTGSSRFTELAIQEPKLAAEPVRGIELGVTLTADAMTDGSRAEVSSAEVTLGKMRLRGTGLLERSLGHARGVAHVEVPLSACADGIASIPAALAPLFQGVAASGTFALSADLGFDTRRLADTRFSWSGENGCQVRQVPAALDPSRFRARWEREVLDADGLPTTIETGPGTAAWVPYAEISPFVPTAVIVCEDSRFFSHRGFDSKSISDSIRDNLRAGRFVRGGSTVTMQLAKNLFLGREKTLSRKLQEAGLTLLLEQSFTKEELLELYLNVVEFGPGIYGIGPAASRYFDVPPKRLSLAQAFYLVSLLPNPSRNHLAPDGSVGPVWAAYLKKLMAIARKIHRIDDGELEAGLAEEIRVGAAAGPPEVPGAGSDVPELPENGGGEVSGEGDPGP